MSWCAGARNRWAAFAALVVFWGPLRASADYAIPPGQDELLAEIFGRGSELPGGCLFTSGSADGPSALAHYDCSTGGVAVRVVHPASLPKAAATSRKFAFVVDAGVPPSGLIEALATRARERESEFQWREDDRDRPGDRGDGLRLAVALAVALLAVPTAWCVVAAALFSLLPTRSSAVGLSVAVLAASPLAAAMLGFTRQVGASLDRFLRYGSGPTLESISPLFLFALGLGAGAGVIAWGWSGKRTAFAVIAVASCFLGVQFPSSLLPDDLRYFGALSTMPASSPSRAGPCCINRRGFRAPEFDDMPTAGIKRVVLVGDSFVFGAGIEPTETLDLRLRELLDATHPATEILNLGIPGNNLSSHLTMVETAAEHLHPHVVVVGLTLANDLSRWDGQVERRDARRASLYSFVRFWFGELTTWIWSIACLERAVTGPGLEFLREQTLRWKAMDLEKRGIAMVVFGFREWDPRVRELLAQVPGVTIVGDGLTPPEHFLPNDGHPSALGIQAVAARVAPAVRDGLDRVASSSGRRP